MNILVVFVLGILLLDIHAAPAGFREGICGARPDCDREGPVCVIDENGELRTFENKCMVYVASCHFRTYYVEVKEGVC